MRHRRTLELPFQESTGVPAPQQAPAPRPGDLPRPVSDRPGLAVAATIAPAQLWLAVHLAASPSQLAPQDLERLGARAQRLTPRVSLDPPDSLLLEVKGSLHLFGGVEGVSREMAGECLRLRMPGTLAVAPTPLAALALARAGRRLGLPASLTGVPASQLLVTDPAQLVGKLSPLPLATLRWPQDTLGRLARIGVRTIGEALRLPRAGFAWRFGTAQLQTLDRLVGRASDLKDRFEVRARFRRRRELLYELESQAALLTVLGPLLEELGNFLEARQCGVLALECRLWHRAVPPTCCVLRLAAPLADPAQLAALLGERLSALVLPEPVRACELRSGPLVARVLDSGGLWQPGERGGGAAARAPELIERLRARLGAEAVHGLQVVEDHRPEAAWEVRELGAHSSGSQCAGARRTVPLGVPGGGGAGPDAVEAVPLAVPGGGAPGPDILSGRSPPESARPLWLLSVPRKLRELHGRPRRRGELRLVGEAERIETGWWDGREIARDYYTAVDARGVRLWVFREREPPHRWFLHGVFG
ncbi:MAG: DNA polymerase Y family protein [Proteobacteria bacterium]|nr:DNA polymerase Y family protein [Pseudomonadota bacterium]